MAFFGYSEFLRQPASKFRLKARIDLRHSGVLISYLLQGGQMKTVMKFGGTSLATADRIRNICNIIKAKTTEDHHPPLVVVSAVGGITDRLIDSARQAAGSAVVVDELVASIKEIHAGVFPEIWNESHVQSVITPLLQECHDLFHGIQLLHEVSPRTLDMVVSFGERLSAFLLSAHLTRIGHPARYVDARRFMITDLRHGGGHLRMEESARAIRQFFTHPGLSIVTGFIAASPKGVTTNLGRGGSDTTAAVIGAALDADRIEIWTDVDGFMSADPRLVENAFVLPQLNMDEASELSYFGAKVIHPQTLMPAVKKAIPVWIKNSFAPDRPGTLISKESVENPWPVRGLSSINNIGLINVQGTGMVGVPGIAQRVFGRLASNDINVIMISQASSEHSICLAVKSDQAHLAQQVLRTEFESELQVGTIDCVDLAEKQTIIAVVGEYMRGTPGISGKLFGALGRHHVNVAAIAQGSSERNISLIVDQSDSAQALKTIHEAFFSSPFAASLYLIGPGQVGGTLLQQLLDLDTSRYDIQVYGVLNSRRMLMSNRPVDLSRWREDLESAGEPANLRQFVDEMVASPHTNRILVDCTASEVVARLYPGLLARGVHVVTPNKRANTLELSFYRTLLKQARQGGQYYHYSTTVGAGLPMIRSLRDLIDSGDTVFKIEGILSASLNFIFASLDKEHPFSVNLDRAHQNGYTEPDPREDLSGLDVARKLIILAREIGWELELDDVVIDPIITDEWQRLDPETFWQRVHELDGIFESQRQAAAKQENVLRPVATLENHTAHVALCAVDVQSELATCSVTENIVQITSRRFQPSPLTIKGPGAGVQVTAAGVLADIRRICE
jgi:aspartokinase/homoserine dehydrogenase 1